VTLGTNHFVLLSTSPFAMVGGRCIAAKTRVGHGRVALPSAVSPRVDRARRSTVAVGRRWGRRVRLFPTGRARTAVGSRWRRRVPTRQEADEPADSDGPSGQERSKLTLQAV